MIAVTELSALRGHIAGARGSGNTIGLVPTMGALHEGHRSLVRLAKGHCGFVAVSIFVNPLQFAPSEDLSRYPRQPEKDRDMLIRDGVDLLYRPDPERFYPPDFSTHVDGGSVTEIGEGAARPGHFRGVATVVAKLFLQVTPDVACFGQKDLQQVAVVRRLIRDLDFPIRLIVGETVREPDGLALSSRNAYLSSSERRQAAFFPRALFEAQERVRSGERDPRMLERETREALTRAGFSIDYVDVVNPETMQRLQSIEPGAAMAAAVRIGKTRLIDNVLLLEQ